VNPRDAKRFIGLLRHTEVSCPQCLKTLAIKWNFTGYPINDYSGGKTGYGEIAYNR
jgi:hypothetical protein